MKKRYILPSVDVIINVRIFMRNNSSLRGKCVNSFFKKIVSLFFEKAERRVKPLMYAQLAILIGVIFLEVLVSNSVDNYWNYSAIRNLMLGTVILLITMESFVFREKKRKDYLIFFIAALLFYGISIDIFFLN
ncbi:hypothetical protein [Bacillus spizizenii]|uniref:hypothetical protein n=1 Tax=Bacillus spizizenii TaxID=96241 RepID=UPI0009A27712|nr:hypothetical protein [Bacillus spizizenii]MED0870215.1 hypothetical protein [Bacillus spizizenii]MED1069080.1 hypothetical protein [Bacillus spizizenii]OPG89871.1 hypothetical protein B2I22_20625 [Bacillus spizizenii]